MRSFIASAATVLMAVPVFAQGHTRTIPKVFTGYHAPAGNLLPFARTKGFIQTWYRGSDLPIPTPILDLGWRIDDSVVAPAMQHMIEIVLTSTTADFATLSKTFASNLGNDATVFFSLKTINLPAQTGLKTPDAPSLWLTGDRPFLFRGPHLIVQADIQTSATPVSNNYYADALAMGAVTATVHAVSETSCGGAITAAYSVTSGTYDLAVTGALPNGVAIFMIGRENTTAKGIPLPLDLSSSGMTGCVLGLDPLILVAASVNSSGQASLSLPFTVIGDSVVVHAQAVHSSTANSTGLATSNVAHSILGGSGLTNYVYNWTVFGPVSEYGPYPTNQGAVVLLRP